MIPPVMKRAASLVIPAPDPVPTVGGQVYPAATASANHVSGQVQGRAAAYSDVQAGAWYTGRAGRDLRNGGRFGPRGLAGIEDGGASVRH